MYQTSTSEDVNGFSWDDDGEHEYQNSVLFSWVNPR
jgi:hypothetical protein